MVVIASGGDENRTAAANSTTSRANFLRIGQKVRRSADRRRRVLYQTHAAPETTSPATRRDAEMMRAARQEAKVFGSRVRQPLRGRWFSLVPVSSLSITFVAGTLVLVAVVLTFLHHLATTWPQLAYREAVARPLLIHRSDSFASSWMTLVLLLATGTSLLVYQLRRHRSDDYRGHYRLWRLTLVVLFLGAVSSTVSLVSWFGALMDIVVGDRAALSGENWLRLLLDVAGIILAMRLVAEVYRCRTALVATLASATLLTFSEAAAWNMVQIDTPAKSTLVTAAPMLAFTSFLIATTAYLRLLYRQARNIAEGEPLRQRVSNWASELFARDDEPIAELEEVEFARPDAVAVMRPSDSQQKAAPARRRPSTAEPAVEPPAEKVGEKAASSAKEESREHGRDAKPKRGWFGSRKSTKATNEEEGDAGETAPEETGARDEAGEQKKPKKGWFSLRLRPQVAKSDDSETPEPEATAEEEEVPSDPPKKQRGLGGFFARKKVDPETEPEDQVAESTTTRPANPSADLVGDELDPDDIDWSSMSKSERRRMRKRLKRGRAA